MKNSVLWIVSIILMSSIAHAQNNEKILAHYQKRGLTFSSEASLVSSVGEKIVKEIYGRLNIPVKIIDMPAKRALVAAMDGTVDGDLMRIMKVQEVAPRLIRLSPHANLIEGVVYSKNPDLKVEGWDTLKDYRIGARRGIQWSDDATKGYKSVEAIHDNESLMKMLNSDRVDLVLTARFIGMVHLKKLNLDKVIHLIHPPLATFRLYNYLHIKHRNLAPIIEDLLAKMYVSGELQKLRERFQQEVIASETSR
jgi:ABC-type amino acid transport substrate-binding protein